MFADVCLKDAEELREIAAQFDALGKKLNGDFLREVANRHEILSGAYRTSVARYERGYAARTAARCRSGIAGRSASVIRPTRSR